MKLLLEHGADPSIATDYNVTPLMVASGIGWVEGVTYEWSAQATYDTVKLLLDLGADVNAQDTLDERTALIMYDTETVPVTSAPAAECVIVADGKITYSRFIFDRTPFDAARQAAT